MYEDPARRFIFKAINKLFNQVFTKNYDKDCNFWFINDKIDRYRTTEYDANNKLSKQPKTPPKRIDTYGYPLDIKQQKKYITTLKSDDREQKQSNILLERDDFKELCFLWTSNKEE